MQFLIEFAPLLIALGAYLKFDIYAATIALMVTLPLIPLSQWATGKPVSQIHVWSAALVILFGTLTLILRDPVFIMWKPTVFYTAMAAGIIAVQLVTGHSLLKKMLGSALALREPDWRTLSWIWAGFFLCMAILNITVAYNFPEATWFQFKVWGLTGLTFLFIVGQSFWLAPRMQDVESTGSES